METWQRLCGPCFERLPPAQRAAIRAARFERRPLDLSKLTGAAVLWLREHSPAAEAARRTGETL